MARVCLYFRTPPTTNRWFYGDKYLRDFVRFLFRKKRIGGVEKVFLNLCHSFNLLNIKYFINMPFDKLAIDDQVIVLGAGRYALKGYNQPNKIVAGIALMTHPSEWPDLCEIYPIAKYLQHSDWARNVYVPYYGPEICDTWFAGIETEKWKPTTQEKAIDFLIYNKIRWDDEEESKIRQQIIDRLIQKGWSYKEIIYGQYNEQDYFEALKCCKAMIFLCSHESQGFACLEALSMDVPVFAWDQGYCLDPNRFLWNDAIIPATSVPFFDETCGLKFKNFEEFNQHLVAFFKLVNLNHFNPREYITKNLSLEASGKRMLQILDIVYK